MALLVDLNVPLHRTITTRARLLGIAELHLLAARKKAAEAESAGLQLPITDANEDTARRRSLSAWCERVSANRDGLSYNEKRLALDALGVTVSIWRPGATDDQGKTYPR